MYAISGEEVAPFQGQPIRNTDLNHVCLLWDDALSIISPMISSLISGLISYSADPFHPFKKCKNTFPPSPEYWNAFFKDQKWPSDWRAITLCLAFLSGAFDIIAQNLLLDNTFLWCLQKPSQRFFILISWVILLSIFNCSLPVHYTSSILPENLSKLTDII